MSPPTADTDGGDGGGVDGDGVAAADPVEAALRAVQDATEEGSLDERAAALERAAAVVEAELDALRRDVPPPASPPGPR